VITLSSFFFFNLASLLSAYVSWAMQNSGQKNGARIDYKFTTPLVFFKMKLTGQACGIGRRVAKKEGATGTRNPSYLGSGRRACAGVYFVRDFMYYPLRWKEYTSLERRVRKTDLG
jgi:hypothetical protein